jgi:uncharacterized protein YkwD
MTNCLGASASGPSAGSGPALSLFVRRATIAAALLAVPVVAAFAISASASATAPAASAGAITSAQDDGSDALIDTQSAVFTPNGATVTEVKYTKKKKKVVKKKPAVVAPAKTKAPVPPSKTTTENSSQSSALEASVINLTNAQRLANGCGAMHTDNRLTAAALAHSADMVTHNYFDHTGSDGSDFVAREVTAGYARNNAAAENIAWGYPTAQAVVAAWMASPGHRANILNCANVAVGVGLAKKADGTSYWTQDFGRV